MLNKMAEISNNLHTHTHTHTQLSSKDIKNKI